MSPVQLNISGGLARITLDRPPANAIDLPTATALRDQINEARENKEHGALVLTGTGDCFCAGLDLKVVPNYNKPELALLMRTLSEAALELYSYPRPTVAALNGHAVAAGSLFTLCCDYRVAPDRNCKFGFTGARVGMPYPDTAMLVIQSELDPSVARRLLLSARTFEQDLAIQHGLVDELVPGTSVLQRAEEVARDMGSMPAADYVTVKEQIRGAVIQEIVRVITMERAEADGVFIAGADA